MNVSRFYEALVEFKARITDERNKNVSDAAKMVLNWVNLKDSNLVQISGEMIDACTALMPSIPGDTQLRDIKMPFNEVWYFDKPLPRLSGAKEDKDERFGHKVDGRNIRFDGLSIAYAKDQETWQLFGLIAHPDGCVHINQVIGLLPDYSLDNLKNIWTEQKYKEDNESLDIAHLDGFEITNHNSTNLIKFLMAVMVWRESKIVVEESVPIERHIRKRLNINKDKKYNYLVLRRMAESDNDSEPSEGKRTYSIRWIVSGHFRRQWYPSEKKHKLIFISPYIKGPEGMEIRERVKTLIKVVR